jgi:hypothetical protein
VRSTAAALESRRREGELGALITELLIHARTAYDRAVALNARHRERDVSARVAQVEATVSAVAALSRVSAQLQVLWAAE